MKEVQKTQLRALQNIQMEKQVWNTEDGANEKENR
jgi:hypothetical protein